MADVTYDIESFRQWATKLGCPPDAIPCDEALKSVFKSPQRDFFCTLMKRVHTRQEVESLRDHILLRELAKLGQINSVPVSTRAYLPQQLQNYLKFKDLEKKRAAIEARIEERKKEYEIQAADLKAANVQIINQQHQNDQLLAKIDVLHLKSKSLTEDIKKEEEYKQRVMKYMPVKLNAQNANEALANEAIERTINLLNTYYEFCATNSSPIVLQTAKEELWLNIWNTLSNVPNYILFQCIMRLKEQQLQHIIDLSKSKHEASTLHNLSSNEPMNQFEKALIKLKIDALSIFVKYKHAVKEREQTDEVFYKHFNSFVNDLQPKVVDCNPNEDEDHLEEVVSEYLIQYNFHTFFKTQNEYIQKEIDKLRTENEQRDKQLENHELLLGTVKQTYEDINSIVSKIHSDMAQLNQIKQKIMYSSNMLKHKANDLHVQTNVPSNNTLMHGQSKHLKTTNPNVIISYVGSGDSFECGTDSVLCSTKLDFDVTFNPNDTNILGRSFALGNATLTSTGAESRSSLPAHTLELTTFASIPMEKFSNMSKECAFYLKPNPLILESREYSWKAQLAPGALLTQYGALQEVRNLISWADSIAAHSTELNSDLELSPVDIQGYKERTREHRSVITRLLDEINAITVNTEHSLQKAKEIYNFILENPLRQYIPPTLRFNGRTYAEYEAEFKLYYRMVAHDADA